MVNSLLSRCAALSIVTLFLAGALGAGTAAGERASARASDQEPNDSQANAIPITSGEVVEGTLMLNPTNDYYDYYKIDVPYGKVLNASLYLIDYDDANPGKYDFSLYLYVAGSYWYIDNSSTKNRWESVIGVQYTNPAGTAAMYVTVMWGSNNQGGRYALSASVSDATVYSGGNATGALDNKGPNGRAAYKLDPGPSDDRRVLATLKTPATGNFSMHLYNIWPVDNTWNLHNESWLNVAGHTQQAIISGCGGTWYAIIKDIRGNGTYTFSVEDLGWALDGNNLPSKATLVRDDDAHQEFVDQGADWVDWWMVDAKTNRSIDEAYCAPVPGTYDNWTTFNFSAWDKDLRYLTGASFYGNQVSTLRNITVKYDGPVYFTMRAMSRWAWGEQNFVPARCWYKLSFELPNDPPILSGPLPEVRLLEDTSDDSLVLSAHVTDPDNDTLTYAIFGSGYHSRPRMNATTGRLNITPEPNWFGSELIRFRATDDGPGFRFIDFNTTVVVEPVNDPPIATGSVEDLTVAEEVVAVTPDVVALFKDVDDPAANLTITLKISGSDTHPPNSTLPMQYDAGTRTYRLGPARQFFGTYQLQLACTDRHTGTIPAEVRFNLTVVHKNHAPALSAGIADPTVIVLEERGNSSALVVADLFSDLDAPSDYAGDTLNYTITGMSNLTVTVSPNGRLVIDTGDHQYLPGRGYEERLLVTAKDRAGLKATLNITVRINALDDPPFIHSYQPDSLDFSTREGKKEVFRVSAADPDTSELTYTWSLDGTRDRSQTGSTYQFQPDYKMGGTVHTLRVVVSDGTNNATVDWNVNVLDVNRLPVVTITQPTNFTKFKKGEFITFSAEARDEDGDNLTYTWRDGAGKLLGTGLTISTDKLDAGTQTVRLEVSDGKGSVYVDVVVAIAKPAAKPAAKGFIPGFSTAAASAAAALAMVAVGVARRRE